MAEIGSALKETGRRAKKDRIREINSTILESALELDRPDLIGLLQDIPHEDKKALFSALIGQYIKTKNEAWFTVITGIVDRLKKKGDRSEVFSSLSAALIETGSAQSDRLLIDRGIDLFSRITFRKYRSEILSRMSPPLIEWAIVNGDLQFLRSLLTLTEEIADISRKSLIIAALATGIAGIGMSQGDLALWAEGIRTAAAIRQKTRRQACFAAIVRSADSSPLAPRIHDIPATAALLTGLDNEHLQEVIGAILMQVLETESDRAIVAGTVTSLAETLPATRPLIVASLLKRAERTGDSWYFTRAMELRGRIPDAGRYPVYEFVRAAVSVFRTAGSTEAIRHVVPAVIASCNTATASRILLQIVQVLLLKDELSEALAIFKDIRNGKEKNPLYDECSASIWKHAIMTGRVLQVQEILKKQQEDRSLSSAIYRAVSDICRQHAFSEIAEHAGALATVMGLHPQRDQLVLDSITQLIHRGFLETANPDVLIRLTQSIGDPALREQALSTIVIRVAKLGVATRSRDFLQRAVGLSCLIEDERTRSQTLTAVIDEATVLAVADGDIDLLRRMREWSDSLLSHDGRMVAIANIISGMITYAGDRRYPGALDEAYGIAAEIADPSLKNEVKDRISESYVRIGCVLVQELGDPPVLENVIAAFHLFLQGLSIIAELENPQDQSLKIAHIIDIILDSAKEHLRIDMVPALALFALAIRQEYERDAMAARIASILRGFSEQTDSNDQYEMIVHVLLRIRYITQDQGLLDLVLRTAEQIKDPFFRSSRFCQIAGLFLQTGRATQAQDLLGRVRSSVPGVQGTYRQVLLLAECAYHYTRSAPEEAKATLSAAMDLLGSTDYDPEAVARGRLIAAIVRLHDATRDKTLVPMALTVASQIREPAGHVAALLQVYRMTPGTPDLRSSVVARIRTTVGAVSVPVQRATLMLDLSDQMIRNNEFREAADTLALVAVAIPSIPVPFLADSLRSRTVEAYLQLAKRQGDAVCREQASVIAAAIGHDEIRLFVAGLDGNLGVDASPLYTSARALAERIVTDRYNPAQVAGLENLVRSVMDRGVIARYFCMIAILFNSTGKTQLARRFLDVALKEAGVIRPLSRRAYVQCDLALMLDHARWGEKAEEVMGQAFDSATGIRQFADRDEVFDNLSTAMRWMREG